MRVPHLLYGHGRWRNQLFGRAAGAKMRRQRLNDVRDAGRSPIVIGGTGLYFKALEQGLADMPAVPEVVREAIREKAEPLESKALHAWLAAGRSEDGGEVYGLRRPAAPDPRVRDFQLPPAASLSDPGSANRIRRPCSMPRAACAYSSSRDRDRRSTCRDRPALRRHDRIQGASMKCEIAALAAATSRSCSARDAGPWRARPDPVSKGRDPAPRKRWPAPKADTRHYAKRQFTWFRHQMPGWRFVRSERVARRCLGRRKQLKIV